MHKADNVARMEVGSKAQADFQEKSGEGKD
jgi:hypothetical protein